jgi:hypothetical protein
MQRRKPQNNGSRKLRLAAGMSGAMAGALLGSGGGIKFDEKALLFICAGAILGFLALRVALRLPSPFGRL